MWWVGVWWSLVEDRVVYGEAIVIVVTVGKRVVMAGGRVSQHRQHVIHPICCMFGIWANTFI